MDFKAKYSREECIRFFSTLFGNGNFQKIDKITPTQNGSFGESMYFKHIHTLGLVRELDGLDDGLIVLEIQHGSSRDARVGLTKELMKLLSSTEIEGTYRGNALVILTNPNDDTYRLSLFTTSYDKSLGYKKILSNPRRQSFLLGQKRIHTPKEQLEKKGAIVSFEDLKKRFSIEVVNKEFYNKIAEFFYELTGGTFIKGKQTYTIEAVMFYPGITNDKKKDESTRKEFGVRLFGRIMFCWFLKQKILEDGNGLIPSSILSSEVATGGRYYNSILEPLFFEILNKPHEDRKESYKINGWATIPYLNGGLFHPQEEDYFDKSPNDVYIPDEWFKQFFEFLELYNFTIDENTSIDQEMSVDPEMLGRIFENLLAEINPETGESARKSTGSFYTPREIVEYMVDESITQYLLTHTDIEEAKIRALISYDLDDDQDFPLTTDDNEIVFKNILNLKIFDPACGSGAYPIGVLQKILYIMQTVDPDGNFWTSQKLYEITDPMQRDMMRKAYENKDINYLRKLTIIRDIIYGCDIQSIAVETSKLRCFLTLIVDEKINKDQENFGIEPLPNLEFKFVCANTLIPLDINMKSAINDDVGFGKGGKKRQMELFSNLTEQQDQLDRLLAKRKEYFSSHHQRKQEIKKEIELIQDFILTLISRGGLTGDMTSEHIMEINKIINWKMFEQKSADFFDLYWMYGIEDGFDIVIGNPPYGAKVSENDKVIFKNNYFSARTDKSGKGSIDTFSIFTDLAISKLTKEKGVLSYILPMSLTSGDSMTKLHQLILGSSSHVYISSYSDRPKKIFTSAETACSILILRKGNSENINLMTTKVIKRYSEEQAIESIIKNLEFVNSSSIYEIGRIPKIGNIKELEIMKLIKGLNLTLRNYQDPKGLGFYYRASGGRYYKLITNFKTQSSEEREILIDSNYRDILCAIYSSNLYYWFYVAHSDALHIKHGDIGIFGIPELRNIDPQLKLNIEKTYNIYMKDLEINSEVQIQNRAKVSEVKTYYARKSKPIIDQIDRLIGGLYGLSDSQIEYIINFDLRFRIDE